MRSVRSVYPVPTHAAESHLHNQRDRITELPAAEGHQEPRPFPSTDAAVKLLWLAICNIKDKRTADRGKPANQRKAQGRLDEGQIITNWKQALTQLAAAYPDRITPYL